MLNILGMIILIIILFIIILLAIGIKVIFKYDKTGSDFKGCLKILIFKKIKVYSLNFPSEKSEEDSDEKEREERDYKKLLDLAKPCFRDLIEYLKSVLNTVRIKKIENHLIFGLDSYADTGKYIGIIWGVLAMITSIDRKLKLSAEPSFNGSIFDVKGENEFEVLPLKLIVPTVRLISKKEIRTLIRGVLDER